jgi:hypothetical protein
MENFAQNLREATILFLNGNQINEEYKIYVDKFLYYTEAYCVELNSNMYEVLYDDKTYNMVFSLFNSIILERMLNSELV